VALLLLVVAVEARAEAPEETPLVFLEVLGVAVAVLEPLQTLEALEHLGREMLEALPVTFGLVAVAVVQERSEGMAVHSPVLEA
jgi:hypothetical protein